MNPANRTATPAPGSNPRTAIAAMIALALVTIAVFWPVGECGFTNMDDPAFIYANPNVRAGLTVDGFLWAFNNDHWSWHPITWLSHMADCELFGVNPAGHHYMSLSIHVLNSLLLFGILRWMTGSFWRSFIVAAIFALHPMRVESVAWACERKGLLSTFFGLITIAAYTFYARRPGAGRFILVMISFAFCLMSKAMLVTMPFLLLLLDFWPLQRKRSKAIILDKLPLLAMTLACSWITAGKVAFVQLPLMTRLSNVFVSYVRYIEKTFWPVDLAILYPLPNAWPSSRIAVSIAVVVIITAAVMIMIRRRPCLAVGWFWYLGTLVPVIGFVQVWYQAMADRFSYVPTMGLLIALVWLVADVARSKPLRAVAVVVLVFVLSALAVTSHRQLAHWNNSITIFSHTVAVTDDNYHAHTNLASALFKSGQPDAAMEHYKRAIAIDPNGERALAGVSAVLLRSDQLEKAIEFASRAVAINASSAEGHYNLGVALQKSGREDEAASHYQKAIDVDPIFVSGHYNLGLIHMRHRRFEAARDSFHAALRIMPGHPHANYQMALALAQLNQVQQSLAYFDHHLRLRPDDARAHYNLGITRLRMGDASGALSALDQAVGLSPTMVEALTASARILAAHRDDAIRDGRRAHELAQHACRLTKNRSAQALDVLAVAQAELGDFENAVINARNAIEVAAQTGNKRLVEQIRKRLAGYEAGKPYRSR